MAEQGETLVSAISGKKDFAEKFRHPGYEFATEKAEEVGLHMDYQKKPEKILKMIRPNEFEAVKQYRLDSWQPVNYSLLRKPLNYIGRVFNKNLMKVEVEEAESSRIAPGEGFNDYLGDFPAYGTFTEFFRNYLPSKLLSDPNGFLVMWPEQEDYDREGNRLTEDSDLERVFPRFIPSAHVVNYSRNYLLAQSSDKSRVFVGGKEEMEGMVYICFTKLHTFRIYQVGEKVDYQFAYQVVHDHGKNVLPVVKMRGYVSNSQEDVLSAYTRPVLHESFFQPAVPHLNELVATYSDYRAALVMHLHPQYYEAEEVGIDEPGSNDFLLKDDKGNLFRQEGDEMVLTGDKGPYNMLKVAAADDGKIHAPGGYIEGPIEIVAAMREEIERIRYDALSALNMAFLIRKQKNTTESGVSMREEKDPLLAFLETLSAEFKRLGDWVLGMVNLMRYETILGDSFPDQKAIIVAPERFTVKDINEAAASLKLISDTEADRGLLQQVTLEFAEKEFGSDSFRAKMAKASILLNPLFGYKAEEIADLRLSELISEEDARLAIALPLLLQKAVEEDPGFLDLTVAEQKQKLLEQAEENDT